MIHYSGQAGRARAAGIIGHEDSFERFKGSVAFELVPATAEEVLNASVPASLRDETLARLARSQLSESSIRRIVLKSSRYSCIICRFRRMYAGWNVGDDRVVVPTGVLASDS